MTTEQRQVSNYNIANVLTVLRIALVPVFGWALLHSGGDSVTVGVNFWCRTPGLALLQNTFRA